MSPVSFGAFHRKISSRYANAQYARNSPEAMNLLSQVDHSPEMQRKKLRKCFGIARKGFRAASAWREARADLRGGSPRHAIEGNHRDAGGPRRGRKIPGRAVHAQVPLRHDPPPGPGTGVVGVLSSSTLPRLTANCLQTEPAPVIVRKPACGLARQEPGIDLPRTVLRDARRRSPSGRARRDKRSPRL